MVDESYIYKCCQDLLKEAGVSAPPVNLGLLASFRGVVEIKNKKIKEAGILDPFAKKGLTIYLRESDPETRRNFTCGHEISHTFFPSYNEKPQKRTDDEVGWYKKEEREEYLCDFGASHLLMPDFLFAPRLKKGGFSGTTLLNISNEFSSSLEATAIKMVRVDPKKFAVVVWEMKNKPSEDIYKVMTPLPGFENCAPEKKLRVKFGFGFSNLGHIPKNKSLDENKELISGAFNSGRKENGTIQIKFSDFFKVNCKAFCIPMPRNERILTLMERI